MITYETMIVYVTKYALTKGILEKKVELTSVEGMVVDVNNRWQETYHGEGKDWHKTWESAVMRAEKMRINKITSLTKSLNKFQNLKFVKPVKD